MSEFVYPAFTPLALILERRFDRKRDCIDTASAQQASRYASLGQAKVGMAGNGVLPEMAVPHGTRSRPSRGRVQSLMLCRASLICARSRCWEICRSWGGQSGSPADGALELCPGQQVAEIGLQEFGFGLVICSCGLSHVRDQDYALRGLIGR
jgi:hypothetical protein